MDCRAYKIKHQHLERVRQHQAGSGSSPRLPDDETHGDDPHHQIRNEIAFFYHMFSIRLLPGDMRGLARLNRALAKLLKITGHIVPRPGNELFG